MSFWRWRVDVVEPRSVKITIVFLPSAKKIGASPFADMLGLRREDVEADDSFPQYALIRGHVRESKVRASFPKAVVTHVTYTQGGDNRSLPFVPDFVL